MKSYVATRQPPRVTMKTPTTFGIPKANPPPPPPSAAHLPLKLFCNCITIQIFKMLDINASLSISFAYQNEMLTSASFLFPPPSSSLVDFATLQKVQNRAINVALVRLSRFHCNGIALEISFNNINEQMKMF